MNVRDDDYDRLRLCKFCFFRSSSSLCSPFGTTERERKIEKFVQSFWYNREEREFRSFSCCNTTKREGSLTLSSQSQELLCTCHAGSECTEISIPNLKTFSQKYIPAAALSRSFLKTVSRDQQSMKENEGQFKKVYTKRERETMIESCCVSFMQRMQVTGDRHDDDDDKCTFSQMYCQVRRTCCLFV